jgi:hypothetical protein
MSLGMFSNELRGEVACADVLGKRIEYIRTYLVGKASVWHRTFPK